MMRFFILTLLLGIGIPFAKCLFILEQYKNKEDK
jgi:hypothetical protein